MSSVIDALLLFTLWSNYSSVDIVTVEDKPTSKHLLTDWETFMHTNNRTYADPDEAKRRADIFIQHKVRVDEHNQLYKSGDVTFTVGVNHFSDMNYTEILEYTGINGNINHMTLRRVNNPNATGTCTNDLDPTYAHYMFPANVEFPTHVDWRKQKAVTPVRNQGKCGSCWAFSTVGVLESMHFRRSGKLVELSKQMLVDCAAAYDCISCDSGWPSDAFRYVRDCGGLVAETVYPYAGVPGECRFRAGNVTVMSDVAIFKCKHGDEVELMTAVATMGPISVAVDGAPWSFLMYKGGVYYDVECDPGRLGHAMLLVGYGVDENGRKYWLLKNSWGTEWGMNGYMRLARDENNHCGIASSASFAMD